MQPKIPSLSEIFAFSISLLLVLLVTAAIRFFPPTAIIHLSHILKKTARRHAPEQNRTTIIYGMWYRAICRIRRLFHLKLNCLTEALVLRTTLGFSGIKSSIKLGIDPLQQPTVAHAWLEVPGVELDREPAKQYTVFSTNPF